MVILLMKSFSTPSTPLDFSLHCNRSPPATICISGLEDRSDRLEEERGKLSKRRQQGEMKRGEEGERVYQLKFVCLKSINLKLLLSYILPAAFAPRSPA